MSLDLRQRLVEGGEWFEHYGVHVFQGWITDRSTYTASDGRVCVRHRIEQCHAVVVDERGAFFSAIIDGGQPSYVPYSTSPVEP